MRYYNLLILFILFAACKKDKTDDYLNPDHINGEDSTIIHNLLDQNIHLSVYRDTLGVFAGVIRSDTTLLFTSFIAANNVAKMPNSVIVYGNTGARLINGYDWYTDDYNFSSWPISIDSYMYVGAYGSSGHRYITHIDSNFARKIYLSGNKREQSWKAIDGHIYSGSLNWADMNDNVRFRKLRFTGNSEVYYSYKDANGNILTIRSSMHKSDQGRVLIIDQLDASSVAAQRGVNDTITGGFEDGLFTFVKE